MKYYIIHLKGKVVETKSGSQLLPFIENDNSFALDRFFVLKEKLKMRKATVRILVNMGPDFQVLPGHLEEIFSFLIDLREAGKELYFYAKSYGLKELFLASACQHRVIPPEGMVLHLGLVREMSYYKNLLDKLDIKAEVFRRGKYKGAADIFRTDKMDEAQTEAYSLLMERTADIMQKTISNRLNLAGDFADLLKSGQFFTAGQAKAQGMVTGIDYWYSLIRQWKDAKLKRDKINLKKLVCGKGNKVAVLSFEGNIVDGDNQNSLLMGKACGDDYYVEQIAKIAAKKKYKAVIFKVNSGGGSASASAEIANALTRLRQKKPLIVVQGGVAGSGGYYISFPGEKIFTHNSTVTGSIGVIYLLFYAAKFMEKNGISHTVLKDGDHADLMSAWRMRDEEDSNKIMNVVDHIYQTFVQGVAKARKMDAGDVENIAQGRIWSGLDAVEKGICDQIGGLEQAIFYLNQKYNLSKIKFEFWPRQKKNLIQALISAGSSARYLNKLDLQTDIRTYSRSPLLYMEELFNSDFYL